MAMTRVLAVSWPKDDRIVTVWNAIMELFIVVLVVVVNVVLRNKHGIQDPFVLFAITKSTAKDDDCTCI